jgi:lipid II:glycine glycyltransferase (peptidoglycan interpeptide bridge formation enzyme)
MRADFSLWSEFISAHPESHILQDGRWGNLKSGFGWEVERVICGESGAQILFRKIPLGYSIAYIPKGPIGKISDSLLNEMDEICKSRKAIFLKIEPFDWELDQAQSCLPTPLFQFSAPIQPRRTVIIDLCQTEEDLLSGMKQKTRYNIRLAEKKEIKVRESSDFSAFHEMALITGKRDGFGIHSLKYYQEMMDLFGENGDAALLMASYKDTPIAGIIVFARGSNSWYMYGASTDVERNRMPTYLLQWEAMKWAKKKGCTFYDLWGIPDYDEVVLEEKFTEKEHHDGLWGVYRFKRGFGGEIVRSVGAWDKPYYPQLYKLYRLLATARNRGMN